MKSLQVSAVGVPWYTRQNYKRILEVMSDAHVLPTTFDAWQHAAEKVLERARRRGATPVKALIDPETFPDWCRQRGLDADANARSQFACAVALVHYTLESGLSVSSSSSQLPLRRCSG